MCLILVIKVSDVNIRSDSSGRGGVLEYVCDLRPTTCMLDYAIQWFKVSYYMCMTSGAKHAYGDAEAV